MDDAGRNYRYLDGDRERQELIDDIRRVRRAVIQMAESTPENRRYTPRYHGWTLAALLAHLMISDRLSLWSIQWALIGVRAPVPSALVHGFNTLSARLFHKRVITTTLRSLRADEKRITNFIRQLPMDKFTRMIYDPMLGDYITVERAVQVFFLFHWQEHLQTLQKIEGVYYEPPERYDTL